MTRVRSQGSITVKFNIVTKDMKKLGYNVGAAEQPSVVATTNPFPTGSEAAVNITTQRRTTDLTVETGDPTATSGIR